MEAKQKEIVLLPYPFSDLEGTKIRPAIIVSNSSFNKKSQDCILVPLTTVLKDEPYSITLVQEDLETGKLLKTSRVRADKIFCVEKKKIIMNIGVIREDVFQRIKTEIFKLF